MSDCWVCIIPKDPEFVPTEHAVEEAARYLGGIAPDADEISSEGADSIRFRDCGANLESIRCRFCASELPTEWWSDQFGDSPWEEGVELQPVSLPCGHVAPSLNELDYHFDQGFSRFILEAMNPNIRELSRSQIEHFEVILGCPVKVIYQHI